MTGPLTNHLWQSTVFAVAAGLLTVAYRRNRANVRYWLWLSASLKFLVPFSMLVSLGSQISWTSGVKTMATQVALPSFSSAVEQFSAPFPALPVTRRDARKTVDWAPLLAAAWLCGVSCIAFWRGRQWIRVRRELRSSRRLEIPAPVEVRAVPDAMEPGAVGFFRAILLLPEGVLESLTPAQLDAVLAHELCHVRRRDNLFAAIHMAVETLFWFHPLVWWIGARLIEERERACDEEVLRLGSQPRVYADAILNVCKLYAESPLACVSGVTGADLRKRIDGIMLHRATRDLNLAKRLMLVCAGVAALAGPVAVGVLAGISNAPVARAQAPQSQTSAPAPVAPKPKFDAASVKPCQPGDGPGRGSEGGKGGDMGANHGINPNLPEGVGGYFHTTPGRLDVTCGSLLTMVSVAYIRHGSPLLNNPSGGIGSVQQVVRGIPKWALSARYTIHAETDDPAANGPTQFVRGQGFPPAANLLYVMLQSLLEDRFQLKLHRETAQEPMYALTVAKGGFKLKPMRGGDCIPDAPPEWPDGGKPPCNWTGWDVKGTNRRLLFSSITVDRMAHDMAELILDRNVIDRTGIAGSYVARLEYAPDENTRMLGMPDKCCAVDPNSGVAPGPTIFMALEQQFGLKLEPIQGPQEHIVIDRVERPSQN